MENGFIFNATGENPTNTEIISLKTYIAAATKLACTQPKPSSYLVMRLLTRFHIFVYMQRTAKTADFRQNILDVEDKLRGD